MFDPQEIPGEELAGRVGKLQDYLRKQKIDVAFIYGDVYHSGDITYLTNICIYWNEGVLAVPAIGEPAFITKLSPRVHPWMKSTSPLKDFRSGPDLASLIGQYLNNNKGVIGLVEMTWWPALIVEELQTRFPEWEFRDIGSIVLKERVIPSESEFKLIQKSAEISARAIIHTLDRNLTNSERAGRAEQVARTAGVEDVFVYCYHSTSQADTIEVITEYRGYWTAAARVIPRNSPDWAKMLLQAFQAAEQTLMAGVNLDQIYMAASAVFKDSKIPWRVDLLHCIDLETNGDYRLPDEKVIHVQAGSAMCLKIELSFADGTRAVIADTYAINAKGARCLTKEGGLITHE